MWLVMEIYFGIFQAVLEWIWYQERYDAFGFSSRILGGERSGLHWYNLVLSPLNFVFLVLLLFLLIGYYAITHFIIFQWQFGEKFTMNCQDCICLEGEHGIICQPHVCDQKKVTCDGEGFYEVTEVNPDDSCCPLFTCSEFILLFLVFLYLLEIERKRDWTSLVPEIYSRESQNSIFPHAFKINLPSARENTF